jgi:transglutaminase-like putative cysteine protease
MPPCRLTIPRSPGQTCGAGFLAPEPAPIPKLSRYRPHPQSESQPLQQHEKGAFILRRGLIVSCVLLFSLQLVAQTPKQRHFSLHYAVKVKDVPAGKELRIWIPLARSDAYQDVQVLSKEGDLKLRKSADDASGNTALYAEADTTKTRDYRFQIEYDVVRFERIDLVDGKLAPGAHPERSSQAVQASFLQSDRLTSVTGPVGQVAADETRSSPTPLDKAHALYDYIWRALSYDPSGHGCCRGDANWVFDSKHGDSTDLTALFVAMARSQQIPARSAVGIQLPADKHSGKLTTNSSWAEFYAAPLGWLPADIAAAKQHPEQREYYFGAQDINRLQFTVGRDIKLNPPQDGAPLNFFIDLYVEVGGEQYSKVSLELSFQDVGASATGASGH